MEIYLYINSWCDIRQYIGLHRNYSRFASGDVGMNNDEDNFYLVGLFLFVCTALSFVAGLVFGVVVIGG